MSARDEFYVGYLPSAPSALAAWLRPRVVLLCATVLALGLGLVATLAPFSTAVFEFGVETVLEGVIEEHPVPALRVARPGAGAGDSRYLLSCPGKHGAAAAVAGLDGQRVRLRGSLVHRADRTMVEVVSGGIERLENDARGLDDARDEGVRTLRGEIVDSKCFLGVMKPGDSKPHRACAVRCLSGGIPPVLRVRDAEGGEETYVLVGPAGEPLGQAVLDRVAEPVEVTGRVLRRDDLLFLHAAPGDVRRLRDP